MSFSRFVVVLSVAACLSTAGRASAQTHPVFGEAPTVDRLENGLTVVTVPWNTPGIVSYFAVVRVGSRDEVEPGRSGFAHLFEHMMFRGTARFPEDVYEQTQQSFGADTNAYTTMDYTVYTITAPSANLAQIVDMEADRFQNLDYTEEQYRTETGAVLGEYNTGAADPMEQMWEKLSEIAYQTHTYGHTTMGYLTDVCAMPEAVDYSRQFLQRYYTPDNTTLIVVGDVERDTLLPLVQTHYSSWTRVRFDNQVPQETSVTPASAHIVWAGATPPQMLIGYRSPAFDGHAADAEGREAAIKEVAALEVVRRLLFDESSPFFQRLVVDEQRALELSSWPDAFTIDPGLFEVSVSFAENDGVDVATLFDGFLAELQAEFDLLAEGQVAEERVAQVVSHMRYALLSDLETPESVANTLAQFIAVGGGPEAMVEYIDALSALTTADIAQAAASYLTPDKRFVVTLAEAQEGETAPERPTCADLEAQQ
ncbi:MAG: insulinase family protein [Myxococcales bacterium]|nr:insulinase family protein [Myxococcales bacterium]